jgi:hypothetical protein
MDMGRLIEQCRQSLGPGAKGGGGLLAWIRRSGGGRDYDRTCGRDDDFGFGQDYRLLLEQGRVVWGAVAQANTGLFVRGPRDLPANTVYSLDPHFDAAPEALRAIAHGVFEVKETTPPDPEVARMAALIADEKNHAHDIPLPRT